MMELARIKRIISKLQKLWEKTPDQRLGQVLENYIFYKGSRGDNTSCVLFYQEDDDTEKILDVRLKDEKR